MQVEDLREVLIRSPTKGAAVSALSVLNALARDGDFDATIALIRALARELGHDPDTPGLTATHSILDLLAASDVPPLLRVYCSAFRPSDFLADADAIAKLAADAPSPQCFTAFKLLVRRHAVLRHEALKAFVLCALARQFQTFGHLADGGVVSPGGQLAMLERVLNDCRLVPGDNSDADLHFGQELLLRMPDVDAFFFIVYHELGHNILDAVMGSTLPSLPLSHEAAITEVAASLPTLVESACRLSGKAIEAGDPRGFHTSSGITVICTYERPEGDQYFHWSLTQQAGPVDVRIGARYAFFILSILGVDLSHTAVAYSKRGVFHFACLGKELQPGMLGTRLAPTDVSQLVEVSATANQHWINELRLTERFGESEQDVPAMLGVAPKAAKLYAANPQRTIDELNLVASLRSLGPLQALSDEDANTVLAAIWRSADPDLLRTLLLSRAMPQKFLLSAQLSLAEIGENICAIRNGDEVTYHGPMVADIRQFLLTFCEFGGDVDAAMDTTGSTLLIAASCQDADQVRFLLSCGADPNRQGNNGETPMLACASLGSFEAAKELIAANASVDAKGRDGNTALHRAIAHGNSDLAQLLLEKGAEANTKNNAGETPLIMARSVDMIELLCRSGAAIDATDTKGTTALINAAGFGIEPVVRALMALGADPDTADGLGATALHHAVLTVDAGAGIECLRALLDAGADVDEETNEGMTPLMVAAHSVRLPFIQFLLAHGADVNARNTLGDTALIMASDGRNEWSRDFSICNRIEDCIHELVKAGADVNAQNDAGNTPLLVATWGFHAGIVQLLLELGADANLGSRVGVTPLGNAAVQGHAAMVDALIAAGAEIEARDQEGNTPLLLAIKAGQDGAGAVPPLLKAGASVTNVNAAGKQRGDSPHKTK